MPEQEKEKDVPFALRLPVELRDQLKRRSEKNRRSMNQEIVTILERFADSREVLLVPEEEIDNDEPKDQARQIAK